VIQPDKIVRSARKTLSVSVDALGRVTVRAPKGCSEERLFSFLQSKEAWIIKHKTAGEKNGTRLPTDDLDGYTFLLVGKPCTVRLTEGKTVSYDTELGIIGLPRKGAKARLVGWLKDNAQRILENCTAQTAREMGVAYKSVEIGSARSKWGSCAYDNALRYSFRLLYAPKAVVRYVVVHELAHVRHKNHSALFWREVEKYDKDYKIHRKWLKDNGFLMQIF
jgi:predicted metal-dependent hydrolase